MFILPDTLNLGGPTARYRANITAMRLAKHLTETGTSATDADRDALCRYVGWGDSAVLKLARPAQSYTGHNLNEEMREILSEEEQRRLLASTINAHYTDLAVIRAIWYGVELLGLGSLDRIRYLDPSAGIGHFLGAAPASLRAKLDRPVMVELDTTTAAICRLLYPEASVENQGFERCFRERSGARTLRDWFDLCISNVPFGRVKVADAGMQPRAACASLHNYFITRMLELTRPGGLTVAITSRYTLDGTTSAPVCRRAWSGVAQLELAIRLPETAFKANAGTEVVTDVLFLRKLRPGEAQEAPAWLDVADTPLPGKRKKHVYDQSRWHTVEIEEEFTEPCVVNRYYTDRPDLVLGTPTLNGTMFAKHGGWQESASLEFLSGDFREVKQYGGRETEVNERRRQQREGRYTVEADGRDVAQSMRDVLERYARLCVEPAAAPSVETRAPVVSGERVFEPSTPAQALWWNVYLAAKACIRVQMERCDDEALEAAQQELNCAYDAAPGRATDATCRKAFVDRPDILSFLFALETPRGEKEAIFSRRTILPEPAPVGDVDPADAVFLALDQLGCLDMAWVARACHLSEADVLATLGNRVYMDPVTRAWLLADEYLSGNVRRKLREARAAAEREPDAFARNVDALLAPGVQPPDLEPADVSVSLNAKWVGEEIVTAFVRHLYPAPQPRKYDETTYRWSEATLGYAGRARLAGGSSWTLDRPHEAIRDSIEATQKWGTARMDLHSLLVCGLDGKPPVVYDEVTHDGKARRVVDQAGTVVAQAKLDDISHEYRHWLWADEERATTLLEAYNDRFNCWRVRKFDGSFLTFPGMNQDIQLRSFQADGAARVLFGDKKSHPLLCWPTGSGKTFGGIVAVEKLLQLGLASKALICVPKHLVSQWVDDYRRLFPGRADQILCAGKDDLSKKERGTFLARAATGGFRVVILSHTQLKAIPVQDETFEAVVREQLAHLEAEIKDLEATETDPRKSRPLKQLQTMKANLEGRIRDRSERTKTDSSWTITFEELGFDVFVGDEAQAWKNLQLVTKMGNVAGIRTGKSQISLDFLVKARWFSRTGGRLILATATPVANSLAESFVFATYLQHELLREHGIENADAFFGAFTRTYSSVELEPSCKGHRVVSRLEFGNLPELQFLTRQSYHVVKPEELDMKLPQLATGQEIVRQIPGSPMLRSYIDAIAERVDAIRGRNGKTPPQPEEDNMLKVCSDGRWASIVNGDPHNGEIRDTKLDMVVAQVLQHWRETADQCGTQLVFCDLGVPAGEKVDVDVETSEQPADEALTEEGQVEQKRVYEYIRQRLLASGVPAREVAFLQEHEGDTLRGLYTRMNDGDVRVLLGSVPTGMNVQRKLVALHHIDPVWRPDWKTQRDGRILRQGNENEIVYIYIYLTEGSFDAYMWGLIRQKLRVIDQFLYADAMSVRRLEGDVGELVLRAGEIQAIASGNPRVLEFVGLQNELMKLSAVRDAWERGRARMETRQAWIPAQVDRMRREVASHQEAAATWAKRSEDFEAVVGSRTHYKRVDADEAVLSLAVALLADDPDRHGAHVGRYCGFTVRVRSGWRDEIFADVALPGLETYRANVGKHTFTSIDRTLDRAPGAAVEALKRRIGGALADLRAIEAEMLKAWEHEAAYESVRAQYGEIAKEMVDTGVVVAETSAQGAGG